MMYYIQGTSLEATDVDFMQALYQAIHGLDGQLTEIISQNRKRDCSNDFARKYARKHFSQSDEDGLTLEIFNRLCPHFSDANTFLEIGVGNGQENNTLVLLTLDWRGVWIGGEDLCFSLNNCNKLAFVKSWITVSNVAELAKAGFFRLNIDQSKLGLLSLDLDGNDYYVLETLLQAGLSPEVIICEYNAIFPPNAEWCQPYNESHQWKCDHLFGASLLAFVRLLEKYGYFLVACNPQTGCNAFFTRKKYRILFPEVPTLIEDVYVSPYYRVNNKFAHAISREFLESVIN